ncbi:MAG TPA: 1,4-alpha-glucan branching enzyme, partial [Burkholderiaceae bacterium]|nr:1,4-alpha-glucan branching enzyme [Burkholderiaceae bacterium]
MLSEREVDLVRTAQHGDPFSVLGPHRDAQGQVWIRAMLPGASEVAALDAASGEPLGALLPRHADGVFEGRLAAGAADTPNYRLQVRGPDGSVAIVDDPYRFPPVLGELDVWLLAEGSHLRP